MAMVSAKSSFGNVVDVYSNLVITSPEIQLSEKACSMQLINQFLHYRNRKFVHHCFVIEGSVIDKEAPCTILFFLPTEQGLRRAMCWDELSLAPALICIDSLIHLSAGVDSDMAGLLLELSVATDVCGNRCMR